MALFLVNKVPKNLKKSACLSLAVKFRREGECFYLICEGGRTKGNCFQFSTFFQFSIVFSFSRAVFNGGFSKQSNIK